MKRETYMHGTRNVQYGIWNSSKKCWQFGICEDTPMLAEARLHQKIGDDAKKWRFEARPLPASMMRDAVTLAEHLQQEVKQLEAELKAAIDDLESACASLPTCAQCGYCAHYPCSDDKSDECEEVSQWKWRGPQKKED